MNSKFSKIIHEIRSLFILVIIVLTLKVTIFELYIVPTGSMENTIMTGDFLAAIALFMACVHQTGLEYLIQI